MQKLPKYPWPSQQRDSKEYQKCCEFLLNHFARRDDSQWPMARAHLLKSYLFDPGLIDQLHDTGSIYADHSDIIFPHRVAGNGDIIGASLLPFRCKRIWMPIGDDRNAWFMVGNLGLADSVIAVESPIEALSYLTLFPRRRCGFAVVSCIGIRVPCELMVQLKEHKKPLIVAFKNNWLGMDAIHAACSDGKKMGIWVSSESPSFSWAEDLVLLKENRP